MRPYWLASIIVTLTLVQTSCATSQYDTPVPARASSSGLTQQSILLQTMTKALGKPVRVLAKNAFVDSSYVTLERHVSSGRSLEKPHHFRLLKNQQACFLQLNNKPSLYQLPANFHCVAEPQ